MRRFQDIAKAELHAHLNGSLPPAAMRSLLSARGLTEETDLGALTLVEPVRGLEEYFRAWKYLRALPTDPDALRVLVTAAAQELVADGVTYAELRNSITYIASNNRVPVDTALGWLLDAFDHASQETSVDLRLVISLTRESADSDTAGRLLAAIQTHVGNPRLVGVDLCGDEDHPVPDDLSRFFRSAKDDLGLGVTIHAGETGNVANVWWALEECRADRIGHCLAGAANDHVIDVLESTRTCVEVCLTSNRLTGFVQDLSTHPVVTFSERGVPFVICADNPQLHGLPLSGEYELFSAIAPNSDTLTAAMAAGFEFAFAGGLK